MSLRLIPLRQEDVQLALTFIQEASEWAPRTGVNIDPISALSAPNSVWLTALSAEEVVGIVGVHSISWPDRSGELACGVVPKWRRRGVAKVLADLLHAYCFDTLNLRRLTSTALEGSPMAKVAAKCGLTQEGRHRGARFKEGKWLDTLTFALLKEV